MDKIIAIVSSFFLTLFPFQVPPNLPMSSTPLDSRVLGVTDESLVFRVNIPAIFKDAISAPNVLYSLRAGEGIAVSSTGSDSQSPTITNTGILELVAGSGISVDGNKITNTLTQGLTSLSAGTGISVDGNKITNTLTVPTPDYTQSGWTRTGTSVGLTTLTDSVTVGALTAGAVTVESLTTGGLSLTSDLTVASGHSLLPDVDLGSDIGTSSYRFNNLWVANINSNSSQSFSGQTTFSYAPTDTTISQASVLVNPTVSATNGQLLGLAIGGYQRALIDEDGDLVLGYNSLTSAPATDYPLDIYGHNGTRVSFVDTSGNGYFAGNVGIGTTDLSSFPLAKTVIMNGDSYISSSSTNGLAISTNSNQDQISSSINVGGGGTGKSMQGLKISLLPSTNTGSLIGAEATSVVMLNNPSITSLTGFKSGGLLMTSGTITSNYGFYADNPTKITGTLTNNYGVYIANQTAGTNNWGLYSAGGNNYFAGNVGIGMTSPSYPLDVTGVIRTSSDFYLNSADPRINVTQAASALRFAMNGTEAMRISSTGNVGIGTTSPNNALHVKRTAAAAKIEIDGWSGYSVPSQLVYSVDGTNKAYSYYNNTANVFALDTTASGNGINIAATSANVGIGTTSPTSKLHVSGAVKGKALAIFDESGDQALLTASASGVAKFVIDHSGNVGIGTTSPSYALQVGSNDFAVDSINHVVALGTTPSSSYRLRLAGGAIRFEGSGSISMSGGGSWGGSGTLTINPSSGDVVLNPAAGNVGIGTTTPSQKLDVVGAITASTFVNGSSYIQTAGYFANTSGAQDYLASTIGNYSTTSDLTIKPRGAGYNLLLNPTSGKVGIGTTTPGETLEVKGAGTGKALISQWATSTDYSALSLSGAIGYGDYNLLSSVTDRALYINRPTGRDIQFREGHLLTQLTIKNTTGNIGIGTSAPTSKLHLSGAVTGKSLAIFDETGDQNIFAASASGVPKFTIARSGNIGIGTSTNSYAINAIGGIYTNDILFAGSTVTGTNFVNNYNSSYLFKNTSVTTGQLYTDSNTSSYGATLRYKGAGIDFRDGSDGVKLLIKQNGLVNATTGGLATYTKAGTISDTDFADAAVDGLLGFDSANGRLYVRNAGAWSYIAKTAGFQIPDYESVGLEAGDYLIPYVEKKMEDGAVHGLYSKWSEVKNTLLSDVFTLINQIEAKITAMREEIFTKKSHQEQLCVGTSESETCVTKDQLDKLIELIPSPSASSSSSPAPSPSPTPTPIPSPSLDPSPTATPSGVQ